MKIMTGGHGIGKTTQAIKWASENDAYIICSSKLRAVQVFNYAKMMLEKGWIKEHIRFPISSEEILSGEFGGGVKDVVFEDVDILLAHLVRGANVVGFTATGVMES